MININIKKEASIVRTPRVEMLETMFEVPATSKLSVSLEGSIDVNERPWNIGLIVGPSGSGKTLLLNELFGQPQHLEWYHPSVIDDFNPSLSMEAISRVCQSVGFNTIPSWLRPYSVLSNGERFRVEIARRLLGNGKTIVIDEFTSVVDRQVAQIASHAVQKYVREKDTQLVCASCHYDIIEWLQPDWLLEPGRECKFTWRSLQRRPPLTVSVSRVKYETWKLFRDFHYMSQELNRAARCYGIFVRRNTAELDSDTGYRRVDESSNRQENNQRRDGPDDRHPTETGRGSGNETRTEVLQRSATNDQSTELREANSETGTQNSTGDVGPAAGSVQYVQHGLHDQAGTRPAGSYNQHASPLDIRFSNDDLQAREGRPPDNDGISGRTRLGIDHNEGRIASMCGVLHRPHPRVNDICGFTRMVTLPDWQGIGLAFVLATTVASAYRAMGKRLHSYPNHPAWIRSYQRSKDWLQIKQSGEYSPRAGKTSRVGGFGDRRCAVFMYIGSPMNRTDAEKLIGGFDD